MSAKLKRSLRTVYLYGDGHAVEVHEERHRSSGKTVEWVEVHEKWGPKASFPAGTYGAGLEHGAGRLILSAGYQGLGLVSLVRRARYVETKEASVEQGTSKTKAFGIAVASLDVGTKDGLVSFTSFPSVMSDSWTFQAGDEFTERWSALEGKQEWSVYRIAKRFPAPAKEGVNS